MREFVTCRLVVVALLSSGSEPSVPLLLGAFSSPAFPD
jgi:hypothetical protein